jgi:hypothetical protein
MRSLVAVRVFDVFFTVACAHRVYTATYVKRQGQWRMLALQMAPRSPRWQ